MSKTSAPTVSVEVLLTSSDLTAMLRADVRNGLLRIPKSIPPKWFYDQYGSQLFDDITRLPEYYLTRCERDILAHRAADVAAASAAVSLVELGAGSAGKTRLLLDALLCKGTLTTYVPVDVSGDFLVDIAGQLANEYPGLSIRAVVADFERQLHLVVPRTPRRLIAFLGSTIGNLEPAQRRRFLRRLRTTMDPEDTLLLGVDLVKSPARLRRAYDDAGGVTAEFNRNVLRVINRELRANFEPAAFDHVAIWDPANEWVEMQLSSPVRQVVRIGALDRTVAFAAAEQMRTEVSAKFRRASLAAELANAGLAIGEWWTDPAGDFAVCLAWPTIGRR